MHASLEGSACTANLQWLHTHIAPLFFPPWQAKNEAAQRSLDAAIKSCSWDNLIRCIVDPDSAVEASHKLVHLRATGDPPHGAFVTTMASQYVIEEMADRAGVAFAQHMRELLMTNLGESPYEAAAGRFFESFAHRVIQARLGTPGPFMARVSTLLHCSLGAPCSSCNCHRGAAARFGGISSRCCPRRDGQADCCMLRQPVTCAPPSQRANAHVCSQLLPQVRRLSPPGGEEEMLEIASTVTRYFNKLEDIKDADAGVYCIPMSPNFPAIDALEQPSKQQPGRLYQMTTHQKRDIRADRLKAAVEALRPTPGQLPRYYFVVPGPVGPSDVGLFDTYKPVAGLEGVEQWVMEVPIQVLPGSGQGKQQGGSSGLKRPRSSASGSGEAAEE